MNIVGICKECGADVNLLENEVDDCIYECPECGHPHDFFDFLTFKDEKFDAEGMLELKDVIRECTDLYGDKLNVDGVRQMARYVMKLDHHQNQAYNYVTLISNMVEEPKVYENIMSRFKKLVQEK